MTDHTPISKISRLEVVSTGARRRWTLEEKQRIVAESYDGPRLVSVTARRNGLSASQLFTWRRLAREGRLSGGFNLWPGEGFRSAFKAGITPAKIAREFGISQSDVRKALVSDDP